MTGSSLAVLGCVVAAVSACEASPLPATRAVTVARAQCSGGPPSQADVALIHSAAVLRVEPMYSHILTGNNNSEDRVSGARILVRPPPGVDAGELTRVLQCHGALAVLGKADPSAVGSDPYFMPDAWVAIEVTSEDGHFTIAVTSDSVGDNLQLLRQARKYGDEHMVAAARPFP
jgi:hypothetical protein